MKLTAVGLALCAAAPAVPLAAQYRDSDKSHYYFAYDYGMNILRTLEPGAIYFPCSDLSLFPLVYLQAVDGVRPDVTIMRKFSIIEEDYYKDMPEEVRATFANPLTLAEESKVGDWMIAHTDRPVYLAIKRLICDVPGVDAVNAGLIYKIATDTSPALQRDDWNEYTWHSLREIDAKGEYSAKLILSAYHAAHAQYLLCSGDNKNGIEEAVIAAKLTNSSNGNADDLAQKCRENLKILEGAPDLVAINRSLARGLSALGDSASAVAYLERAIKGAEKAYGPDSPHVAGSLNDLGVVLGALADPRGAQVCFARAVAVAEAAYGLGHPKTSLYINNLGVVLHGDRERQRARECFERALDIDQATLGPDHIDVARDMNNLGVTLKDLGDTAAGQELRRKALEIFRRRQGEDHSTTRLAKEGSLISALGE